jgi:O-acetyl-ADP-ribose deacetylase (regulator of RNase III)
MIAGNLVRQKTEAIVNPANVRLKHGGGAARVIAEAAGQQLQDECERYIKSRGTLKKAEPMHTSAGKLWPPIRFVIHVAGPDWHAEPDKDKCRELLKQAFYNCLHHANYQLKIQSMSIPAISSGNFAYLLLIYVSFIIVCCTGALL